MRPLKRPINHGCVSLSKKFSEATHRGQKRLKIKSDQNDKILKSYREYHMWGVQKYQNHYEIPFGRGWIDLKNSAVLLLLAQGNSDTLSLFEDFNMARYFKNIFLIWINVNRLCWHVGLEFWTINSFICPKSTNLTTCQFCFTTLYWRFKDLEVPAELGV